MRDQTKNQQRAVVEAAAQVRAGKHDDTTTIFVANLHFKCDEVMCLFFLAQVLTSSGTGHYGYIYLHIYDNVLCESAQKELKSMVEDLLGEDRAHVLHSIRIMKDRSTGRSRGLAYVNMKKDYEDGHNHELVQKVVLGLNDREYQGRKMRAEVSDLSKKRKEKAETERKTGAGAVMFRPRAVSSKKKQPSSSSSPPPPPAPPAASSD